MGSHALSSHVSVASRSHGTSHGSLAVLGWYDLHPSDLGACLVSLYSHIKAPLKKMDKFQPDASDRSRNEVPANGRFTSQAATAEDLLKAQTVGLVNLNDYRKRRAEALDLKERGMSAAIESGASTPTEEYDL